MIKTLVFLFNILFFYFQLSAQGFVFRNATIHVGNGQLVENGLVVIEKSKILYVGKERDCKIDLSTKRNVDIQGKHIYPGLISLYSNVGLVELEAIRQSADQFEIGQMNTHIKAESAFNVDSDILPTLVSNGILIAQTTPRGGLISGNSSAMYLNGWTAEEALIKSNEGLHINWPEFYAPSYLSQEAKSAFAENRLKDINQLKILFREAKVYLEGDRSPKNLRFESLKEVFEQQKTLYFYANKAKEILEIISFVNEFNFKKVAIVGGNEALLVSELLSLNNIPVVLTRLHSTPPMAEDQIDFNYILPYKLKKAGVKFAFSYFGDMEAAHSRNLPFLAGTAVAYGLDKEEALASITSIPAEILGIESKLGTISQDKEATFIISNGDIFDMKSSNIESIYLKGEKLEWTDKQKVLNEKYIRRYKLN